MPEENRLIATIIPKIDEKALRDAVSSAFTQAFQAGISVSLQGMAAAATATTVATSGTTATGESSAVRELAGAAGDLRASSERLGEFADKAAEAQRDIESTLGQMEYKQVADESKDLRRETTATGERNKGVLDQADEEEKKRSVNKEKLLSLAASSSQKIAGAGINLIQQSFGVLEDIYNRLKQSSPLLQSVESLFNLAMTLFFMPIGTKLASEILPATLELVDAVVDMWDAFEGETLSDMFAYAMEYGVQLFSDYFVEIGESLANEEGLLGTIGNLLITIGEFIEDKGESLLNAVFTIIDIVLSNLKEIITLIAAFYGFYIGYTIAKDAMGILSIIPGATLAIGTAGGLAGAAIAGTAAYGIASYVGLADGGYVPARDGGTPAIIGEGGEGEYVIPESKMGSVGGNTINYYFYGYTDNDILDIVRDEVSTQVSRSRIRGDFRCPRRGSSTCA